MTLSERLYSIMSSNAALSAACSNRIYPNEIPQGVSSYPLIVYRLVTSTPTNDNDGTSAFDYYNVDIWSYGTTKLQAEQLAEKVRTAVDGYATSPVAWTWYWNADDDYLESIQKYVIRQEYRISLNR